MESFFYYQSAITQLCVSESYVGEKEWYLKLDPAQAGGIETWRYLNFLVVIEFPVSLSNSDKTSLKIVYQIARKTIY